MSTPAGTVGPRLLWPDVAKGGSILLVVLHHVVTKHHGSVVPADSAWLAAAWTEVSFALKPVRMPLFFLVSGLFAASAVTRPWSASRRRVLGTAWLYVVWLTLLAGVFAVERDLPMNRTQDLGDYALDLLFASTGLWFLYALVVYFVLVRATAAHDARWVVGVGAAVAALAWALPVDATNRVSVLVHFVFFALGARRPDLVHVLAGWRPPGGLWAATAAFVAATAAVGAAGLPGSVDTLVLAVVALPWGVQVAVVVSRRARTARGLAWLGRRTLPVYVLHVAVLAGLHRLHPWVDGSLPDVPAAWQAVLLLVEPVVLAALVVGTTLALHRLLLALGATWLFEAPEALVAPRERAPVSVASPSLAG